MSVLDTLKHGVLGARSHGEAVRLVGWVLTVITSWFCLAGAKNHAVADTLPLPRIVVNEGKFQNVDSGQVFTPRGFNYIQLNAEAWHNTFEPGAYDSARAESMFADLASSGFNTTRVFIDQTIGPGSVESFEATELSPAYMANVFDFLERARDHEIYVVPNFAYWVGSAKYATIRDATPPAFSGAIENVNQLIVDSGHVAAKAQWMADFASAIASHDPALNSTILSYQIENEANLVDNFAPFNQTSGTILGPGGKIYDLSTDAGKQSLADDAAVLAANTMTEAIKLVDPNALVSMGLFTNNAVGRPGFGSLSTHTTDDTRFPLRPLALLESDLDYLDLHLYPRPGLTLQQDLDSMEWDQVKALAAAQGVPITMGEFGVSKFDYPDINDAMNVLTQHLDAVEAEGFEGSLMWTYDTNEQSDIWNAKESNSDIFNLLAARNQVPEPSTLLLAAIGLVGLLAYGLREGLKRGARGHSPLDLTSRS